MPFTSGDLVTLARPLLLGLLVGSLSGVLGGLFARLLPRLGQRPLLWGLVLGAPLAAMALLSGGWSGGDGEVLMKKLLDQRGPLRAAGAPEQIGRWLLVGLSLLLAPALVLAAGVPGGLIDPSLSVGALFGGGGLLHILGRETALGVALGMTGPWPVPPSCR